MRINSTPLITAVLFFLAGSLTMHSGSQAGSDQGASIRAHFAFSISLVQVQLAIANDGREIVALPLCGESNLCGAVLLEWAQDPQGKYWRRTSPHLLGDVSFSRVIEIKKGESQAAVFQFNPLDWKFEDGSVLRYPGKVRLAVRVWQKKEWIGHDSLAQELLSDGFDIPSPPAVGESRTTQ
jgi:hypothetical protein